jgi:hypothetical protein
MEYNNVDGMTDEEDSSFPEMVSPLNIFVWIGSFSWILLFSLYLADLDLKGFSGDVIWYVVTLSGLPISWAVVSFIYRRLSPEEINPESDATEL